MGKKGGLTSQAKRKKKIDDTKQDSNMTSLEVIVEAILEKKGTGVIDIDLSDLENSICDRFIIANADSTTQVAAIADNVEDKMIENLRTKVLRRSGNENALWIILDYGDTMVHIFQTEYRNFYRLEELWSDGIITSHEE